MTDKISMIELFSGVGAQERAAKYTSASARYKMAGNSICVCCLIAIFSSLFLEDGYKSDIWTKYSLNYWD